VTFLITCAGSKIEPVEYRPSNLLNLYLGRELFEARETIQMKAKILLNWEKCLPAYALYSGKHSQIYSQIDELNFLNINSDVLILSALFGWIKPTDLIPYYDLRMSDKIDHNEPVWKVWKKLAILHKYINEEDIDLLSKDYRKAIVNNPATVPDVVFEGYGIQKGRWLNKQLNNFQINAPNEFSL